MYRCLSCQGSGVQWFKVNGKWVQGKCPACNGTGQQR